MTEREDSRGSLGTDIKNKLRQKLDEAAQKRVLDEPQIGDTHPKPPVVTVDVPQSPSLTPKNTDGWDDNTIDDEIYLELETAIIGVGGKDNRELREALKDLQNWGPTLVQRLNLEQVRKYLLYFAANEAKYARFLAGQPVFIESYFRRVQRADDAKRPDGVVVYLRFKFENNRVVIFKPTDNWQEDPKTRIATFMVFNNWPKSFVAEYHRPFKASVEGTIPLTLEQLKALVLKHFKIEPEDQIPFIVL